LRSVLKHSSGSPEGNRFGACMSASSAFWQWNVNRSIRDSKAPSAPAFRVAVAVIITGL
jgi:hypothetical protein